MSRPPHAREKVLDAFEALLIESGTATLESVAQRAEVSKGGLLYHFSSKTELEGGLIERLHRLTEDDVAAAASAPRGPVAYYIASSGEVGSPLDRAIIAVSRLAHAGSSPASAQLRRVRDSWADVIRPHVRDTTALDLVMLVGDGLYLNAGLAEGGLPGPVPTGDELDALIERVERAAGAEPR